jgi:hypothetical protein
MTQWHPIFAELLRPVVEAYYEMETTVPVGDAPREADIVLLRRASRAAPPFRGLWRHLTTWNILEFKGPTVSPRRGDLELLLELGLGIDRRLRREHTDQRRRPPPEGQVSFWYLANDLRGIRRDAERKLGDVEALGPGLWRSQVLGRLLFLVSAVDLPVEEDSLPLHVIGKEPPETERQVAELVATHLELQALYGGWMMTLHPAAWKEVEEMARKSGRPLIDFRPAIEHVGLEEFLRQIGKERLIEHLGSIIDQVGKKKILKRIGINDILANLSPDERRELKRRLE